MSFDAVPPHLLRAGLALLIGCVLGFAARRGRFCTLGAIEDAVYAGDTRRLRAWALAIAVAMAGAYLLQLAGLDLSASLYGGSRVELGPVLVGGVLFGFGMALVGTCGFGSLLRLGGGDLKAFVTVLIMAVSAVAAMRGLTALVRIALVDPLFVDLPNGASQLVPALFGFGSVGSAVAATTAAALLAAFAFRSAAFRREGRLVAAGAVIGLCIVAGWWASGIAGYDSFGTERPVSFSFARPIGDTILYAMLASGMKLDFGMGAVAGVVLGAMIEAVQSGRFRWEAPDDGREMTRHILGAFLMGTGGVTAMGCTVGQGITGLATLSLGSALATAGIFVGVRLGLYVLVERVPWRWRWSRREAASVLARGELP